MMNSRHTHIRARGALMIISHRKRRIRPVLWLKPEEWGRMGGMDTTSKFADFHAESTDLH